MEPPICQFAPHTPTPPQYHTPLAYCQITAFLL